MNGPDKPATRLFWEAKETEGQSELDKDAYFKDKP